MFSPPLLSLIYNLFTGVTQKIGIVTSKITIYFKKKNKRGKKKKKKLTNDAITKLNFYGFVSLNKHTTR